MTAASQSPEILFAGLPETYTRTLSCLDAYRAACVRTYEEAKQALQERLFRMVVIDLISTKQRYSIFSRIFDLSRAATASRHMRAAFRAH